MLKVQEVPRNIASASQTEPIFPVLEINAA